MSETLLQTDVRVSRHQHVAMVEIQRPPFNFFDTDLIARLADVFEALDIDASCRSVVLCSEGSAFCAGADLTGRVNAPALGSASDDEAAVNPLYREALRLFSCQKPVVAAIHGSAIGGGLGLALVADFRVTCKEARFSANFNRIGFHPGFGLSVTLPRLIGLQKAALLFYSGRRIEGDEATAMGLADVLVAQDQVRKQAMALASEIADSAPLAVISTRTTLRAELLNAVRRTVIRESGEQRQQFKTLDFREGVAAIQERRLPVFSGH